MVKKIAIVAGEASGDQLAAHLIKSLRQRVPELQFYGIAGPKMQAAGATSWYPMEMLSVRGYVEVLKHYRSIVRMRKELIARLKSDPPDLFIGVDAPDFNLEIERQLKKAGVTTVHYVSPSIWAWRAKRVLAIKKAVSLVLCVFPFEPELYKPHGVPARYVGYPLADFLPHSADRKPMREQLRLPAVGPVVTFLPGSRNSELEFHAELFIETAKRLVEQVEGVTILVPLATRKTHELFESALYRLDAAHLPLKIMFGHAHEAMTAADVVLAASGTATLEAALLGRPMVITYKMPKFSWWLIKRKRLQPWVGLPNILAGRFVVPELLQEAATPEALSAALLELLNDKQKRAEIETAFDELYQNLRQNTAQQLQDALLPLLGEAH